jgi:ligand-binding SRPBCC domain-containing protein
MVVVQDDAVVKAPIERIFLLSTRVELVKPTLKMKLVEDPSPGYMTSGHVVLGSRVHWYGWKFGLPTHHHTLITGYAAPHAMEPGVREAWFQDQQAKGRFAFFQHDHWFRETRDAGTGEVVTGLADRVQFKLPFGWLGELAAKLLMVPHVRGLVRRRYAMLAALAEGDGWREYISG